MITKSLINTDGTFSKVIPSANQVAQLNNNLYLMTLLINANQFFFEVSKINPPQYLEPQGSLYSWQICCGSELLLELYLIVPFSKLNFFFRYIQRVAVYYLLKMPDRQLGRSTA